MPSARPLSEVEERGVRLKEPPENRSADRGEVCAGEDVSHGKIDIGEDVVHREELDDYDPFGADYLDELSSI